MISPRSPKRPLDLGHILIEDVRPAVELGRWPAKRGYRGAPTPFGR